MPSEPWMSARDPMYGPAVRCMWILPSWRRGGEIYILDRSIAFRASSLPLHCGGLIHGAFGIERREFIAVVGGRGVVHFGHRVCIAYRSLCALRVRYEQALIRTLRIVRLASESTNTLSIVLIFSARAFLVQPRWTIRHRPHGRAKHL